MAASYGMTKQTLAESKRIQRARKRREGYVLKQIWVKPEKWEGIKKLINGAGYANK